MVSDIPLNDLAPFLKVVEFNGPCSSLQRNFLGLQSDRNYLRHFVGNHHQHTADATPQIHVILSIVFVFIFIQFVIFIGLIQCSRIRLIGLIG